MRPLSAFVVCIPEDRIYFLENADTTPRSECHSRAAYSPDNTPR